MTLPALSPSVGGRSIHPGALAVADILVSTGPAWISRRIREATDSPVSHAMLYVGDGCVIEAVGEGVIQRPVGVALSDAGLAVAYRCLSLTPAAAVRVRGFAREQVGRGYDYRGLLAQAGYRLDRRLLCEVRRLEGCEERAQRSNLWLQDSTRFFCSELVAAAFAEAGVPLTSKRPSAIAPGDVTSLDGMGYLGHLRA